MEKNILHQHKAAPIYVSVHMCICTKSIKKSSKNVIGGHDPRTESAVCRLNRRLANLQTTRSV